MSLVLFHSKFFLAVIVIIKKYLLHSLIPQYRIQKIAKLVLLCKPKSQVHT